MLAKLRSLLSSLMASYRAAHHPPLLSSQLRYFLCRGFVRTADRPRRPLLAFHGHSASSTRPHLSAGQSKAIGGGSYFAAMTQETAISSRMWHDAMAQRPVAMMLVRNATTQAFAAQRFRASAGATRQLGLKEVLVPAKERRGGLVESRVDLDNSPMTAGQTFTIALSKPITRVDSPESATALEALLWIEEAKRSYWQNMDRIQDALISLVRRGIRATVSLSSAHALITVEDSTRAAISKALGPICGDFKIVASNACLVSELTDSLHIAFPTFSGHDAPKDWNLWPEP